MNGNSILSDTNPLIYLLTGNKKAEEFLDDKQIWISVISEMELFGKKGLSNTELNAINYLVNNCFIAELNTQVKQITKDLLQSYSIRLPDAIIAATAIYLDLPLVTADADFKSINELKLVIIEF